MQNKVVNGTKNIVWDYKPNEKQEEASSSQAIYTMMGGSRGSSKTTWLVNTILEKLWATPNNRAYLCRKVFLDFRMTTYQTLQRWIPWDTVEKHDQNNKEIVFINKSVLLYGGLDNRQDIERLKGAEFGVIGVDQVEELTDDEFDMFTPTMRLKLPNGERPKYQIFCTANPAQNWVKEKWITNPSKDYRYIHTTCKDNRENLPDNYEDLLRKQWEHRPEMVLAYVEGDWNAQAQENVVIKYNWILDAMNQKNRRPTGGVKRIIACDPARFGDDLTVVYGFRNYEVIGEEIWGQTDTMTTAGKLVILKERFKANMIAVDVCGLGAGIVDRLREMGQPVFAINSSAKSDQEDRYLNLRAQMWEEASRKFFESYPIIPHDQKLAAELNAVQYRVVSSNGKIKIEEKDDVKKRLGRSPDKADCLVYGLYAIDRATPWEMSDRKGFGHKIKMEEQTEKMLAAGGDRGGW